MDRLNYFNPYQSKGGYHEDQLTRAYLVLLKHSSHAFFTFFEYCRSRHSAFDSEQPISVIDYLESGWEIETQKGNPDISTNYLLSILITDSQIYTNNSGIQSSERNARYDGIITFGNNLTMVIENKPRSYNVWFEQLNPSRQNLSDDTIVYSNPSVLEWKEIIKQLNHLLSIQTISGYEKIMIEDFLSFIDENFSYLNPYDSFHQCKGNRELLNRRINNLLKSISLDENNVKYHRGWGFYIHTPYSQIQEIGLILGTKENEWWLELSLYFGDSQRQAKSFFNSNPDINHLNKDEWGIYPNFHVSFMTSNLVWFHSNDINHYLQFWMKNANKIYQHKRDDIPEYIKWLVDEKVILATKEVKERLDEKFYNTAMQSLNICPGLGLIYSFTSSKAEELDKEGKLKFIISEKIREGLKVVGLDVNNIIK